ncbi:hypothetical protein RISK_001560 [Rhodopirellula islandica]|uniref:Uncharacterized protein n=1 Tax=Rhodopirellula islandica TaxID=595434 RepID=A0A0J1ELD7_RHOIS|nr:hypothetical protein RISK_001560 [Rhodopirellula islandica]
MGELKFELGGERFEAERWLTEQLGTIVLLWWCSGHGGDHRAAGYAAKL